MDKSRKKLLRDVSTLGVFLGREGFAWKPL
jgi:hypothetical protein